MASNGDKGVEFQTPRPALREQQKLVTRGRLMDGALETFARKGYVAATVDDIVEAAGVSRATFYLYFGSKRDVLAALTVDLTPQVEAYYPELDEALAAGSRYPVRAWMERALAWYEANRTMVIAWQDVTAIEPDFAGIPGVSLADRMPRYLARWPAARRQEARLRVGLLVAGLTRAFVLSRVRNRLSIEYDLLIDMLTDMWMASLQPPDQ